MNREVLIDSIIQTHIEVAARVGADYDDECIEFDLETLSEYTVPQLERELENAKLGTQFDE